MQVAEKEVALWPHQARAIEGVEAALAGGARKVCLTSPTGGGKTRVMAELIDRWLGQGHNVVLYTGRKLLLEQTSAVLARHGIHHGVRAAGWDEEGRGQGCPVQVSSLPTEEARVYRSGRWQLHRARRVLVDECHMQKGGVARKVLLAHLEAGAAYVGATATPLDLGDLYDTLVVAGTTSELRACGALVPCHHYGPDEPDLRAHRKLPPLGEDLSEAQARKLVMTGGVFGRVLESYRRLNPQGRPAILFAPGVAESLWFAEQFQSAGISAAHLDGTNVWQGGGFYPSDRLARQDVLEGSRNAAIQVLCNRFVLREGIDAPWLAHGIFATVFGSLQSYLQSGGRLLRAHPDLASVTLQDHGGNWWRHGSLNADRVWRLGDTAALLSGLREEQLRRDPDREPWRCPACAQVVKGPRCPCGWRAQGQRRARPVVQSDGTLKELEGPVHRPRRVSSRPDGPQLWERMYHRSRAGKGRRTFRAAMALFAYENHWGWPDPRWPLMPKCPEDLFRYVADVPRERLTERPASGPGED